LGDESEDKKPDTYQIHKNGKLNKEQSPEQARFHHYQRAKNSDGGVRCARGEPGDCAILETLKISIDEAPRHKIKRPATQPADKPSQPVKDAAETAAAQVADDKSKAAVQHAAETKPGFISGVQENAGYVAKLLNIFTSKPKAPPKPVEIDLKRVPKFDIQEIPDVMDKMNLPIAAKLLRRWFAGESNYGKNKDDAIKGITHDGKPYPSSMIDTTTISMDWVLSFPRVNKKLFELVSEKIHNDKAMVELMRMMAPYKNNHSGSVFDALGNNIFEYNRLFNFQNVAVDVDNFDKLKLYADIQNIESTDYMLAALGGFQINAAVGDYEGDNIYPDSRTIHRQVTVKSIYIYIKDSFDFFDQKDSSKSQYLGHWSRKGLYTAPVPTGKIGSTVNGLFSNKWIEHALLMDGLSVYSKDAVMYLVTNKDFIAWREKYGQGGDFLIFSKPIEYKLKKPLILIFK
jgi:hypothetical protein